MLVGVGAVVAAVANHDEDPTPPSTIPNVDGELGTAELTRAITDSASRGETFTITGTHRAESRLILHDSQVRVRGSNGATLNLESSGIGWEIAPLPEFGGTVQPVRAGSASLVVRNARWKPDEHRGKWAEVVAQSPERTTTHARRITSNTSDTLVLEHPVGRDITEPSPLSIFTPLDEVVLEDLVIDRTSSGGTNLLIRYCKSVTLQGLSVRNGGEYGSRRGNAISLYQCDTIRINQVETVKSANFGLFIYNSDNAEVENYTAMGWGGEFGFQFKDCRTRPCGGRSASQTERPGTMAIRSNVPD